MVNWSEIVGYTFTSGLWVLEAGVVVCMVMLGVLVWLVWDCHKR